MIRILHYIKEARTDEIITRCYLVGCGIGSGMCTSCIHFVKKDMDNQTVSCNAPITSQELIDKIKDIADRIELEVNDPDTNSLAANGLQYALDILQETFPEIFENENDQQNLSK